MVQKNRWNPFFGWNDFVQTTVIKNQKMGWKQKKNCMHLVFLSPVKILKLQVQIVSLKLNPKFKNLFESC